MHKSSHPHPLTRAVRNIAAAWFCFAWVASASRPPLQSTQWQRRRVHHTPEHLHFVPGRGFPRTTAQRLFPRILLRPLPAILPYRATQQLNSSSLHVLHQLYPSRVSVLPTSRPGQASCRRVTPRDAAYLLFLPPGECEPRPRHYAPILRTRGTSQTSSPLCS